MRRKKTTLAYWGLTFAALWVVSGCGYNKLQGLDEEVKAERTLPPEMERQMAWNKIKDLISQRNDPGANFVHAVGEIHEIRGHYEVSSRYSNDQVLDNCGTPVAIVSWRWPSFKSRRGRGTTRGNANWGFLLKHGSSFPVAVTAIGH